MKLFANCITDSTNHNLCLFIWVDVMFVLIYSFSWRILFIYALW